MSQPHDCEERGLSQVQILGAWQSCFPGSQQAGIVQQEHPETQVARLKKEVDPVHLNSTFPENEHFIELPKYSWVASKLLIESYVHVRDLVWFNKKDGVLVSFLFVAEDLETQLSHILDFPDFMLVMQIIIFQNNLL